MLIISIIIHFALIFVIYYKQRKLVSPAAMYLLVWTGVLLVYSLSNMMGFKFHKVSEITFMFINLGSFSFLMGSLMIENRKRNEFSYKVGYTWNSIFDYICILVLLVSLIFEYKYLYSQLDSPKNISGFLIQLRYLKNYENLDYGIYKYISTLSVFNFGIRLLKRRLKNRHEKIFFWLSVILAISYAILSTGRTNFFLLLSMVIASFILNKKKINTFTLIKFFTWASLIFVVIGVLLKKGGDVENSLQENFYLMSENFMSYLIGPLCSLDVFINSNFNLEYGQNIFRFLFAIFYKIGLSSVEPKELVESYVYMPYASNVYTIYRKYILDFGYFGCLLIIFFLGLITSFLYQLAMKSHSIIVKYTYLIFVYPIVISFFNEQFFSIFSQWMQHIILIILFSLFISKSRSNCESDN